MRIHYFIMRRFALIYKIDENIISLIFNQL